MGNRSMLIGLICNTDGRMTRGRYRNTEVEGKRKDKINFIDLRTLIKMFNQPYFKNRTNSTHFKILLEITTKANYLTFIVTKMIP